MITQIKTKILSNKKIADEYFKTVIYAPQIAQKTAPGQFVNIKVSDSDEPLLRRPFSVHRINGTEIKILYEVVGKGTELLSQKKAGQYLDVIGPLGNGFSMLDARYSMLVAGGMGIAPLLFLAERTRIQYPASRIEILIGAKTKNEILCEKEFRDLGCEVKISTDDGSCGFKGYVSNLLKNLLSTRYSLLATTIYACGPQPMLKEIANISQKYNIPAQASLEEHMACGIGACFGCVVKTKQGYKRVCKEGPVFNIDEIIY